MDDRQEKNIGLFLFSKFFGADAVFFLEAAGKIGGVGESDQVHDFGYA